LELRPFILEVPYRYSDPEFFQMLLRIRVGEQNENDYKTIRSRVRANKKMQDILSSLSTEKAGEIIKPTMFFSRRVDVDAYNAMELEKLSGEKIEFIAFDRFEIKRGSPIREEYIKILDDSIPRSIFFKVGAQVMLKTNIDVNAGLVNGSRGVVSEIIKDEALIVKFLSGVKIRIDLQTTDVEDKHAIAKRTQIPFVLAWCSTIHKSQSSTLDYAVIDLGNSIFCEGQSYVALSRCSSIDGLFISEFTQKSILINKEALRYTNELREKCTRENEFVTKNL